MNIDTSLHNVIIIKCGILYVYARHLKSGQIIRSEANLYFPIRINNEN